NGNEVCTMPTDFRELFEQLQSGRLSVDEAMQQVGVPPVADLGYANVDLHRRQRCGFPEIIFCEGKTPEWVEGVAHKLLEAGQDCLGRRVSAARGDFLAALFPQAQQDRVARTFFLPAKPQALQKVGQVAVITAGTSDLPVAREALVTAESL